MRSRRASCPAAQRIVNYLRFTTEVLRREGLCMEPFLTDAPDVTCETLQSMWKEWTTRAVKKVAGAKRFRLASAIKGTKTLFDEPCPPCDRRASQKAKESWAARALESPQLTRGAVLEDIRSRVRWYMGTRWWNEDKERKGRAKVPDQKGCAELERGCGGTLSVPRHWEEPIVLPTGDKIIEEYDPTRCRIGTAKKKSKTRVVTMQAARAKRLLQPVHARAYDHLCRQPWIVRGEVSGSLFDEVAADREDGELYRSGDFEASTDNLNKDAVEAVVSVLAEALPRRRADVLMKTFKSSWVTWKGKRREIVRGSMMGNSLSFVVLCLLNKICLDRARQRVENCGPLHRKSLVNGDDLFFCGSDEVFDAWLQETKEVGFVINLKKTMVSSRWGDLNSSTYDFKSKRLVPKLNFGWVATDDWKEPEGTVSDNAFELANRLSFPTAMYVLTHRIFINTLTRCPPPLTLIPSRWWNVLVRKRFFRAVFALPRLEPEADGAERKLPMVLGPPLVNSTDAIEKRIAFEERRVTRAFVRRWRGTMCVPVKVRNVKRCIPPKGTYANVRLERGEIEVRRLWFEPILRVIEHYFPDLLDTCDSEWVSEQPGLSYHRALKTSFVRNPGFGPPSEGIKYYSFLRTLWARI